MIMKHLPTAGGQYRIRFCESRFEEMFAGALRWPVYCLQIVYASQNALKIRTKEKAVIL